MLIHKIITISCLLIYNPFAASQTKMLEIVRVTPEGNDIASLKQITFLFNRSVVPLGKMERSPAKIPIKIQPKLSCSWRWLNTKILACNIKEGAVLQRATTYNITVSPGIKAEDGATTKEKEYQFSTTRPMAKNVRIRTWQNPGKPILLVRFNQPISRNSAENFLQLTQADSSIDYKFKVFRDPSTRRNPRYIYSSKDKKFEDLGKQPYLKRGEKLIDYRKDVARKTWAVMPTMPLATGEKFKIISSAPRA